MAAVPGKVSWADLEDYPTSGGASSSAVRARWADLAEEEEKEEDRRGSGRSSKKRPVAHHGVAADAGALPLYQQPRGAGCRSCDLGPPSGGQRTGGGAGRGETGGQEAKWEDKRKGGRCDAPFPRHLARGPTCCCPERGGPRRPCPSSAARTPGGSGARCCPSRASCP